MYSPQLIEHFEHPRNIGEVPDASAAAQVENPACGDIMQLSLRVEGGNIVSARYRTRGCVAAIACGSALTEILQGLPVAQAKSLGVSDIVRVVGQLNPEQNHATHLAIEVLRTALAKL